MNIRFKYLTMYKKKNPYRYSDQVKRVQQSNDVSIMSC